MKKNDTRVNLEDTGSFLRDSIYTMNWREGEIAKEIQAVNDIKLQCQKKENQLQMLEKQLREESERQTIQSTEKSNLYSPTRRKMQEQSALLLQKLDALEQQSISMKSRSTEIGDQTAKLMEIIDNYQKSVLESSKDLPDIECLDFAPQLEMYKSDCESFTLQVKDIDQKIQKLNDSLDETAQSTAKNATLLSNLSKRTNQLRRSLSKLKDEPISNDNQKACHVLKKRRDNFRHTIRDLKNEKALISQSINNLQENDIQSNRTLRNVLLSLSNRKAEVARKAVEISDFKAKITFYQSKLHRKRVAQQNLIDEYQAQFKTLRARRKKINSQIYKLQTETAVYDDAYAKQTDFLEKLVRQIEIAGNCADRLSQQERTLKRHQDHLSHDDEKDFSELQTQILIKKHEVEFLEASHASLSPIRKLPQSISEELESAIEDEKSEIRALQVMVNKEQERKHQLLNAIDDLSIEEFKTFEENIHTTSEVTTRSMYLDSLAIAVRNLQMEVLAKKEEMTAEKGQKLNLTADKLRKFIRLLKSLNEQILQAKKDVLFSEKPSLAPHITAWGEKLNLFLLNMSNI